MSLLNSQILQPDPTRLLRWGYAVSTIALVLALALNLLLANTGALEYIIILPAFLLAIVLIIALFAQPTTNLLVAIVAFVVVADNTEGFQLVEILYAIYLYSMLGVWFLQHRLVRRQPLVTSKADWALTVFLGLIPFTLILTKVFNGDFRVAASELISMSMLLIYYPVKHTVVHHKNGPQLLLVTVITLGATVALVNLFKYTGDLVAASTALHIAGSRVVVNDCLLLTGALSSLTLLVHSQRLLSILIYVCTFALSFAGLIVTQTRGYWLAFLLGFCFLIYLISAKQRARTLIASVVAGSIIFGLAYILIGPLLFVAIGGILERFATIGTALTKDLSLVNRFRESWAVLQHIALNPILGYGPGVLYVFWDIVHQTTHIDSFVHNGYIGLWYKYGIWGLGLVLFFWVSAIRNGIGALRQKQNDRWTRLAGLAGALPLIAITVATLTANPFYLKNYLFIIGISAGIATGAASRSAVINDT